MDKLIIKESVRNLVEFCMKTGDIDNRFSGSARAVEGTRAHQRLQADNERIYECYDKEVSLAYEFETNNSSISIEGRTDGVIIDNGKTIIEEIKSTYKKYAYIDASNQMHWAQGMIYGFIYGTQHGLTEMSIRLSYVQLDSNEVKSFDRNFKIEELKEFVLRLIREYEEFYVFITNEILKRNYSIKFIDFPFEKYREGQKRLISTIYSTIKEKEILFAQAPTGIGKTISTIFPAIKALEVGLGQRIVYLTSKTINKQVAEETFAILRNKGLKFKTITITAKEKACCNENFDCNPEKCIYAKNYYNKVKNGILDILKAESSISLEILQKYAEKYKICPFEFSLDICMYCDGIICDYNYIFDPRVSLSRLIEDQNNLVLVDEAHNLVDRGRNMYSSTISKSQILHCKKLTKGRFNKISSILGKINSYLLDLRNECDLKEEEWFYESNKPKDIEKYLRLYLKESEVFLTQGNKFEGYEEMLQLYFDINSFITTLQLYDESYVTYVKKEGKEFYLTLFCVNPSKNIKSYLEKCYSVIFFSATLSPIKYYISILGGSENSYRVKLPSPFKKENLKVFISPINIRYNYRKKTLKYVLEKIINFINAENGNYIIFSPSYVYMNFLWEELNSINTLNFNIIKQEANMFEEEKVRFLENFKNNRNIVGLCVLGGIFSEGIDLPRDQLIGSIIIGVGYPNISIENNIIKEFFKENGYDYAYIFPGINKIQQGAGRVIRTESDKGRVLLIDDRYGGNKYSELLPKEWYPINKY